MEKVKVYEDGIKQAGIYTPAFAIEALGGKVVAYVGSDIDDFSEVFVDFIADDGRVMQLGVIGQTHDNLGEDMHAYVYNGTDECCKWEHEIEVSDKSCWYEMNGTW